MDDDDQWGRGSRQLASTPLDEAGEEEATKAEGEEARELELGGSVVMKKTPRCQARRAYHHENLEEVILHLSQRSGDRFTPESKM